MNRKRLAWCCWAVGTFLLGLANVMAHPSAARVPLAALEQVRAGDGPCQFPYQTQYCAECLEYPDGSTWKCENTAATGWFYCGPVTSPQMWICAVGATQACGGLKKEYFLGTNCTSPTGDAKPCDLFYNGYTLTMGQGSCP